MKNAIIFSLLLAGLISCDIIDAPYTESHEIVPVDTVQNVLLELFTGHQCSNCPAAESIITQLKNIYGEKLITIAYHTGFYAETSDKFPVDYNTKEGSEFESFFKVQYYPSGMVNRFQDNQNYLINPVNWGSAVAEQLNHKALITMELSTDFNAETRICKVNIKVSTTTEIAEELNLCIFLTEDSLISEQTILGNPLYPGGIIYDYNHMHVFRESFNGTWGEIIFKDGASGNSNGTFIYSKILNSMYNSKNCHIIAFVYSGQNGTILQSKSIKL